MKAIFLNVYDRDLNFLGVIDSYSSLRWRRKYFEAGEFELNINPTANNYRLLNADNIIVRSDLTKNDEFGIIDSWKFKEDKDKLTITVYGRFGLFLLNRRIIKSRINYRGTYIGGFRKLLTTMRPFSKLDITSSDIVSGNVDFQCTYKNVYTYHEKLSRASNIGGKIVLDLENKRYKYVNYVGKDRTEDQKVNTRYEFSEDKSNLDTTEHTYSRKNMITDVLVGGAGEDANRIMRTVTNVTADTHDFDIREAFVDAKNESNKDLSTTEYNAILDDLGKEKLAAPTQTFEATVNATDYRKYWDLGDIVNIKKESWSMVMKQRITEVEEVIEKGKHDVIPTYGNPIAETFSNE